jgi:acylphosphatase
MPTIHLLIKGKVQGVFYRGSAKEQADRLSLTGWVKNTPKGDVEITATGDKTQLDTFIAWCNQGPPNAAVINVEVTPIPDTPFTGFNILRSGRYD